MAVTNDISDRLVRLPLYHDMSEAEQDRVVKVVTDYYNAYN